MAKILVIDDSPVIRNLLKDFLADEGHEVIAVEDGAEGSRLALEEDYDLCICDVHLPNANGLQLRKEILAQKPETLFVITDSLPEQTSEGEDVRPSCPYLTKPFDLDQLRDIVRKILLTVESM